MKDEHDVTSGFAPIAPTPEVMVARLERQLAGMRTQLDRRIAAHMAAVADADAARQELELVRGSEARLRAEVDQLVAELDASRVREDKLRAEHQALLATKTFRLLAGPRRVYAIARQAVAARRDT